jgi:hypothetical protein
VAGSFPYPPTPSSAEVKERVELYFYAPLDFLACSRLNFTSFSFTLTIRLVAVQHTILSPLTETLPKLTIQEFITKFSLFWNFSVRKRLKRCPRLESTSGRHVESHSAYWLQIQLVAGEARHFSIRQPPTAQATVSLHSQRTYQIH